jgi:mevalonate kinase
MNSTTAVAPAKLILMGEHAVVYQRPALVAAIDLWLRVTVTPRQKDGVGLHLAEFDHRETTDWSSLCAYADRVRERWHCYVEDPTSEAFARMRGDDPAHLVKVALGEAENRLPDAGTPPMNVSVHTQQPVGAGFGSSAAVAVAVVKASLTAQDVTISDEVLHELVLDVERRQHGTPSGVDPATVRRGGLVWAEHVDDGLGYRSVTARSPVLDTFRVLHTGTPGESTGTVVDAVRARRDDDPEAFRSRLDRMEAATRELRAVLARGETAPDETVQIVRRIEAELEALGVVPEPVQKIVRAVEAKGGAAKISGAGALSGAQAGPLLVYHPDRDVDLDDELGSLVEMNVNLGAEGVHIQREEIESSP